MARNTIREAQDADLPGITAISHKATRNESIPPDEYQQIWQWLHRRNVPGISHVCVGASPEGRIVAHEGLAPFRYQVRDREATAGFACQLVVQAEARTTDITLFPRLQSELLRSYRAKGIDFAMGATRDWITAGFTGMGFRVVGVMPIYARPCRAPKLVARYIRNRVLRTLVWPGQFALDQVLRCSWTRRPRGIEVAAAERFEPSIDAFLAEAGRQADFHAIRTAAILNWRFVECPARDYRIYIATEGGSPVGYIVLRPLRMDEFDALAVVDYLWQADRRDVGAALLLAAHRLALETRADIVSVLLNPTGKFTAAFRRFGFLRTPEHFSMLVHTAKDAEIDLSDITLDRWHVTWFEHDYV